MAGKMTKMYKTLAKDTGLFAISRFASKLLVFFLTPLYTYILTTEEFGTADLINTTIHFIYPILTLAISDATLRYALDKETDRGAVLNNSLLITLLGSVFLMLLHPLVTSIGGISSEYWWIFVVTFTLFNVQECLANFLKGIGQTKLFAVQGVVQTVSVIVSNILFLVVFRQGLQGYLLSIIIGHTVPIVIMLWPGKLYCHWMKISIDRKLLGSMLKYSIPMIPALLAWVANTSIDKYMIIGFWGLGESGVYSVAHKIPSTMIAVLAIFTQAWQLSAISHHGAEEESDCYTSVYKALNFVSIVVCVLIIGGAKLLAKVLFSKDFYVAWKCVPFLTVSAVFASHTGFLASAFRAAKKTGGLLASIILGALVNALLNFVLIQSFGVIGAAIGTAVGFMVVWLVRIIRIQKIVRVRVPIVQTIVEYALLWLSAAWITVEWPFAYVVFALAFVGILAMNLKQIRSVATMALGVLRKKRKP